MSIGSLMYKNLKLKKKEEKKRSSVAPRTAFKRLANHVLCQGLGVGIGVGIRAVTAVKLLSWYYRLRVSIEAGEQQAKIFILL